MTTHRHIIHRPTQQTVVVARIVGLVDVVVARIEKMDTDHVFCPGRVDEV